MKKMNKWFVIAAALAMLGAALDLAGIPSVPNWLRIGALLAMIPAIVVERQTQLKARNQENHMGPVEDNK